MQVSIVVPLFNCLPLTQAMVASLQASLPAGLAHEIILVDDGSTDGTRAWLATLRAPFHVVLNERNLGYATACNRGAAAARGALLALLNNDLVLPPGWLEPMLAAHRQLGTQAGIVGNIQHDFRTGAVDHAGLQLSLRGKLEHRRRGPSPLARWLAPVRPAGAVTGACILLNRGLWQELGGFDEGYVNGGEDVDLCLRALDAGRENAVALRSAVRHHVSASPGRKARDEENSYRFTRRWRTKLGRLVDRRWCRRYLWVHGFGLHPPGRQAVTLPVFLYACHLRRTPPPEAFAALDAALGAELARWEAMFPAARAS
jgi:O-antigen biosynthesis protein